nr:MAG TPA: hypothetical protein [Bacteriophage sp.]DAX15133.1 MAG TPA: hypothetical protein [Bacteriophage sp.]
MYLIFIYVSFLKIKVYQTPKPIFILILIFSFI